jgi:hypothetical protein
MNEPNRINYHGFTKKYTFQRLQIALHTENINIINTEQLKNPNRGLKMTVKSKLKKIRIVRWLLALRRMPRLIAELNEKINLLYLKIDNLSQKVDDLSKKNII